MAFLYPSCAFPDSSANAAGALSSGPGTPVVTGANAPYMRGRITLALYRTLDVAHCIAHSPNQYIEIARRLAHDPDWRRQVVQSIEDRSFLIFDEGSVEMVRSLETFWESAIREYCDRA
jgi:protein O-GlcNAc transferase